MTVESDADRLAFLADFGVSVSWTPVGGSAASLTAIFDNGAGTRSQYAEDIAAQSNAASLTVRESDMPAGAASGDAVSIAGTAYLVRTILPDGTGMAEVQLERDAG